MVRQCCVGGILLQRKLNRVGLGETDRPLCEVYGKKSGHLVVQAQATASPLSSVAPLGEASCLQSLSSLWWWIKWKQGRLVPSPGLNRFVSLAFYAKEGQGGLREVVGARNLWARLPALLGTEVWP